MDIPDPRERHRGFFFHVEPQSLDNIEQEAAEGVPLRPGSVRRHTQTVRVISPTPGSSGESTAGRKSSRSLEQGLFRSVSATGNRRQLRTSR
jgi:hypothetical protein